MYYLQSRYYSPKTGRFLNADALTSTGQGLLGHNMYTYCGNNPVAFWDPHGLCREVGALLTRIDCKSIYCPTSKAYRPHCNSYGLKAKYTTITGKTLLVYEKGAVLPDLITCNTNNVIAYDLRHGTDNPNIQILNSYLINNRREQREILSYLITYNVNNPSEVPWGRTINSMVLEWDAHNLFARFDQSAKDTDFDKNEEGKDYLYFAMKAASRGYKKYIQPLFS